MRFYVSARLLYAVAVVLALFASAQAGNVGVNYGRVADNLPSAVKVVSLIKSQGIDRIKLYDADPAVLRAFRNSGVKITVALPNEQLYNVARRPSQAYLWVKKNIVAYTPATQIVAIAVGNEVFANPKNISNYLVPAMQNVHTALQHYGLDSQVKVSSPIALSALGNSYPASAGSFKSDVAQTVMKPMLDFLDSTGSTLMVNVYPFFAYMGNPNDISLDYALFRTNDGVRDPNSNLLYTNLFDAQVDAVFAAMEALGHKNLDITITESGWPSAGDNNEIGASKENAATYNGNLVKHVLSNSGTPRRPKASLDTFIFALFNENKKPGPSSERNYGLFYPNEQSVYEVSLNPTVKTQNASGSQKRNSTRAQRPPSNDASAGTNGTAPSGASSWCVAKSDVSDSQLQAALDYACGQGQADCQQIQPGGPCYNPNTLQAHASYAFNSYYQKNSRKDGSCNFNGAAYVVTDAPKYGGCVLPASV
eukprot:TRINITY_DN4584_c0_g1_i2.p1 TRINITY_DN4584_c0_g1~~TRINITY_DN4584_c0_g1_i2.p1  ORF type:complete len:479 (+),score=0.88 TRINITY_DN4584_c0_g1_i2:89-1525(+)